MQIMGIDEAGRGCVIGPMAVGAVLFEKNHLGYLKELKVEDSKLLSPQKREELYPKIKEKAIFYGVKLIPPSDIDDASLNQIDLQEIVSFIFEVRPGKVVFDVPANPAGVGKFVKAVRLGLERVEGDKPGLVANPGLEEFSLPIIVGENKADEKYPVVSAASILAKVERDRVIKALHKEYGDFGSGYMSDERTQKFLKSWFNENKNFPPIVRKKWSPVKKFLEKQERLF